MYQINQVLLNVAAEKINVGWLLGLFRSFSSLMNLITHWELLLSDKYSI